MQTMKANVFRGPNKIGIEEVPRPSAGSGEAVIRITLTTICGTDLHILRGEYPVKPGLVIGHEPVGVIEELGEGLSGYKIGDRVLVGAITPCGQCRACLSAQWAQCGHGEGVEAIGGWRFGNTINGAQAEYLLVPNAQANLAYYNQWINYYRTLLDYIHLNSVRAGSQGHAAHNEIAPQKRLRFSVHSNLPIRIELVI